MDEMVREADLTEARDQLGQLRRMNVRDRIMDTIDRDGALRRSLDDTRQVAGSALSTAVTPPAADALPEQKIPARHYIPPLARPDPHAEGWMWRMPRPSCRRARPAALPPNCPP
ncbi:hypothetical protein RAA17_07405 [Komagataeibacter rhaeticus]|nr:hypothetical protein [Komagataeibacter rhaeticus]